MSITKLKEWQKLHSLAKAPLNLSTLFTEDSDRVVKYSLELSNIYVDYSKQLISDEIKTSLLELATATKLNAAIKRLFSGTIVNPTENRPALHTALRLPADKPLIIDGQDITAQVHASLDRMAIMVSKLNEGKWLGYNGKAITDVINIGIGGSDLGPVMACNALSDYKTSPLNIHFVSSMDGNQIYQLLATLNAATTLILVSSKSFGTKETLDNANIALSWLSEQLNTSKQEVAKYHIIGISSKADKLNAWDIPESNQLLFWDWVGGRYSFWSVIGFSLALSIGMDNFRQVLAGAHQVDEHFKSSELANNVPVMLGLIDVWNRTFLDVHSHAILPYDARLKFLPDYLTQLEMESNGKSATLSGESVDYATGGILWGDVGSNGQHAFYQLLHQGTETVACDFIATINRYDTDKSCYLATQKADLLKMQRNSLANCLAQSRVLAFGNHAIESSNLDDNNTKDATLDSRQQAVTKHKFYKGNQPSTTILFDKMTPKALGQLIAMYEHKTYVMSVLWDINPFDQWGVELGKVMATEVDDSISKGYFGYDASTNGLLQKIYQLTNH